MANLYVRSTDGSDADNGTTWALSKATAAGAAAIDAAGDTIFFSQVHSESTAAAITLAFAGTPANPVKLFCGNDAAEPPTSMTTGAVIATGAGAYDITLQGSFVANGIKLRSGVGTAASAASIRFAASASETQVCKSCEIEIATTASNTNSRIFIGGNSAPQSVVRWRDVIARFGNAAQSINPARTDWRWDGGSIAGTGPTTVFKCATGPGAFVVSNVDFSLATGATMVDVGTSGVGVFRFFNCKLPTSATLKSGTHQNPASRLEFINCDSADTNYRLVIDDYAGVITDETTLIRTGGASDGTTGISWKMVTNANANELVAPLISDPIYIWNDTTGSSKTFTVHILHDSATNLTDAEVWPEVSALTTSGFPLGAIVSGQRATPLTTAADQAASTETWTTTGMTNPNKQKLAVTFTPQEKGWFVLRIYLGKASKTIYACPKGEVS